MNEAQITEIRHRKKLKEISRRGRERGLSNHAILKNETTQLEPISTSIQSSLTTQEHHQVLNEEETRRQGRISQLKAILETQIEVEKQHRLEQAERRLKLRKAACESQEQFSTQAIKLRDQVRARRKYIESLTQNEHDSKDSRTVACQNLDHHGNQPIQIQDQDKKRTLLKKSERISSLHSVSHQIAESVDNISHLSIGQENHRLGCSDSKSSQIKMSMSASDIHQLDQSNFNPKLPSNPLLADTSLTSTHLYNDENQDEIIGPSSVVVDPLQNSSSGSPSSISPFNNDLLSTSPSTAQSQATPPSPKDKISTPVGSDQTITLISKVNQVTLPSSIPMASSLHPSNIQSSTTGNKILRSPPYHNMPTKTRLISSVPLPTSHLLTIKQLFCIPQRPHNLPDTNMLFSHFLEQGHLTMECATLILEHVCQLISKEPNLITIGSHVTIIGDIHGQFYDLVHLFQLAGMPGSNVHRCFLFLGDYVDRGMFSCEVALLLLALKLRYPSRVHLLRGNHETRAMTSYHSFKNEVLHKYTYHIYVLFMRIFDHLPLAAVVETKIGRYFCCHGGLSPELITLDSLEQIDRVQEPPDEGLLLDILWSDPVENETTGMLNYSRNKSRGCSFIYGYNPILDFLERNELIMVVRAHQVQKKGYHELYFLQHATHLKHPLVMTIFSAPNYCDIYNNMGAFLNIDDDGYQIQQFKALPHPYCLPNFQNAFQCTLPLVFESMFKVMSKIMSAIQSVEIEYEDRVIQSASKRLSKTGKRLSECLLIFSPQQELLPLTMEILLIRADRSTMNMAKKRQAQMLKIAKTADHFKDSISVLRPDLQDLLDATRNKRSKKLSRVCSDLSDIIRISQDHFQIVKCLDADNEALLGSHRWNSRRRKFDRKHSFKV